MNKTKKFLFTLIFSIAFIGFSYGQERPNLGYELITDVPYGKGKVTVDGKIVERDLMLDVYLPSTANKDYTKDLQKKPPYPAVILVHGGGFQRGGPRQAPYTELGALHSRMEDYAQTLAPLGYVCFVVEYRLADELPEPETALDASWLLNMEDAITETAVKRANLARTYDGKEALEPAEAKIMIWKTLISAAEDIKKVVEFVKTSEDKFKIDSGKIGLGGHSAGATTVLNATYGLDVPVSAVFPLSPVVTGLDLNKAVSNNEIPPMLHVISQFDEPAVLEFAGVLTKRMHEVESEYDLIWIPGFGHFYPRNSVSLGDDATRISLQERLIVFLEKHLK